MAFATSTSLIIFEMFTVFVKAFVSSDFYCIKLCSFSLTLSAVFTTYFAPDSEDHKATDG